jgi:carboxyl-terminal processing protease
MKGRLKELLPAMAIGFMGIVLSGTMFARNLAAEGTYSQLKLFNDVLSLIRTSYVDETNTESLMKGAYEGLLSHLDPFSEYLTAEEHARFVASYGNDAASTAAKAASRRADAGVRAIKKDGMVFVIAVRPGSDAEVKGITPGDQIRRIGDQPVREMTLFDVESALSGVPGGAVALSVARREEPRKIDADLAFREPAGQGSALEIADAKEGVAVMKVMHFAPGVAVEIATLLDRAAKQKVRRLLIDLRGNAWGSMEEAAKAAGLFVGDTVVARLSGRDGSITEVRSGRARSPWAGQVAVLINASTAEAAELFAAALHDGRSAQIIGEASFGVGAQQEMLPLKNGAWIRLSVRKYMSVAGTSWHGSGLKPDKVIVALQEGVKPADRLKEQLKQAIEYFKREPKPAAPAPATRASAGAAEAPGPGTRAASRKERTL